MSLSMTLMIEGEEASNSRGWRIGTSFKWRELFGSDQPAKQVKAVRPTIALVIHARGFKAKVDLPH